MPLHYSLVRYPSGTTIRSGFVRDIIRVNRLKAPVYAEPFCGGAGIAIHLLLNECVSAVHLNDVDPAIYAFWRACLQYTDEMCKRIEEVPLTPDEWQRQREVVLRPWQQSIVDLGFATFFINRTNRYGIPLGAVTGLEPAAGWGMGATFKRHDLIHRLLRLAPFRTRIHLTRLDVTRFIRERMTTFPENALAYLAPPQGLAKSADRKHVFTPDQHHDLADALRATTSPWILNCANNEFIRDLYTGFTQRVYSKRRLDGPAEHDQLVVFGRGVAEPI